MNYKEIKDIIDERLKNNKQLMNEGKPLSEYAFDFLSLISNFETDKEDSIYKSKEKLCKDFIEKFNSYSTDESDKFKNEFDKLIEEDKELVLINLIDNLNRFTSDEKMKKMKKFFW